MCDEPSDEYLNVKRALTEFIADYCEIDLDIIPDDDFEELITTHLTKMTQELTKMTEEAEEDEED